MADTPGPPSVRGPALDGLRGRFMEHCPDFRSFVEPGTGWAKEEKGYKLDAMERVRSALDGGSGGAELGKEVYQILKDARWSFVGWRTESGIKNAGEDILDEFHAIIGRLVRSREPAENALNTAFDALNGLYERGADTLTYGACVNTVYCALAMARPNEAAPLQIRRINKAWTSLTGDRLFVKSRADTVADYRRFAKAFSELFEIMHDDWGWAPQDWIDIQGFLYIATDTGGTDEEEDESASETDEPVTVPVPARPENLILYGPPGTGKTYKTMDEALRLCGEPVEGRTRGEMAEAYRRLLGEGRIEFATFHQSMAYEDFVEGRQPVTGPDETGEASSAGFRLETVPGVFRRIAKRAESSRGRPADGDGISVGKRQVFKMSIGEANNPEDDHLFDDAIRDGYTIIGHEDIDWSDEKYADRNAIIKAYRTKDEDYKPSDSEVRVPFTFRNKLREGDIVIVSKGNQRFRAIGEVAGGYEYHPRPEGIYNHRRAMRWLWVDHDGVSVRGEIHSSYFMQWPIYQLPHDKLIIPALERYMNSQRAGTGGLEPFVLIIDEINRANISKVFGELITLLEPDKRLGQPHELRVRLPYSGDGFGVPSNLHILGTMNTADRSIALLDTALRRRFTFREMMPDPSVLDEVDGIDLPRLLSTINGRIEYLYDREHQIGHAYFMDCKTRADVDGVMRHKVIPLLAEYFYDDWDKIAAVLGDLESRDNEATGGFLKRSEIKPPPGQDNGEGDRRHRWEVRPEGFDYGGIVGE